MSWSLNIGRVAGTVVRVHLTFLLFLAWIFAASYASGGAATGSTPRLAASRKTNLPSPPLFRGHPWSGLRPATGCAPLRGWRLRRLRGGPYFARDATIASATFFGASE